MRFVTYPRGVLKQQQAPEIKIQMTASKLTPFSRCARVGIIGTQIAITAVLLMNVPRKAAVKYVAA